MAGITNQELLNKIGALMHRVGILEQNLQIITNEDIEITDSAKGIILKSPDNIRWKITIDNEGSLSAQEL